MKRWSGELDTTALCLVQRILDAAVALTPHRVERRFVITRKQEWRRYR